jgi:hypothetical protein
MLQHLLQAHSIFLLHHAATLDDLYSRMPRPSFCTLLERFWTRFIWNWDVLLHGNPAVDIYNGIKLAGGGELGIGVGEEEWGSGEREVLEDFIARTDGLVDLVVSRFGDAPEESSEAGPGQKSLPPSRQQQAPWLAAELGPRPSDGVLFSGIGVISRRSLATVSQWMVDIYKYGEDAYGVGENPTARPRRKKQRVSLRTGQGDQPSPGKKPRKRNLKPSSRGREAPPVRSMGSFEVSTPGIPPPLVKAVEQSLETATAKADPRESTSSLTKEQRSPTDDRQDLSMFGTDTMMRYLSLGYGSSWTLNPKGLSTSEPKPASRRVSQLRPHGKSKEDESDPESSKDPDPEPQLDEVEPAPEVSDDEDNPFVQRLEQSIGKFLIGLSGDLENQDLIEGDTDGGPRIILRTLTIEMHQPSLSLKHDDSTPSTPSGLPPAAGSFDAPSSQSSSRSIQKQLQVAVYIHQPFIFTFLFELHTSSLTYPSFYRSVHHQLGPLQKPLLRSTDPANVASRIATAMGESTTTTATSPAKSTTTPLPPIYDLVYDPEKLTIHGSLPNIPAPGPLAAEGLMATQTVSGSWYTLGIPTSSSTPSSSLPSTMTTTHPQSSWTRIEALNVHTQILNTYIATRRLQGELERTVKTGRGWWVLWMRVQGKVNGDVDDAENQGMPKEAVLVRRAREGGGSQGGGVRFGKGGRQVSGMGWLAREPRRDGSGSSAGAGPGVTMGVAGVSEGVGVDARRWVEGLLSLNR